MKWLKNLLNSIFKHLYSFCAGILLFILAVLLITMSAQYFGDTLGAKILNRKSIEIIFIIDNKAEKSEIHSMYGLIDMINNNPNLDSYHLKIKKISSKDNISRDKSAKILFSMTKEYMQKLAAERKLTILDKYTFADRTQKYIEFSKYNEYVSAETTSDRLKIYIGVTNPETSMEKAKVVKTLNVISNNILRKIDLQPE